MLEARPLCLVLHFALEAAIDLHWQCLQLTRSSPMGNLLESSRRVSRMSSRETLLGKAEVLFISSIFRLQALQFQA